MKNMEHVLLHPPSMGTSLGDTSQVTHGDHVLPCIRFNGDLWMGHLRSDEHDVPTSPAFNQDISGWDTSQVTNMELMFHNAPLFNGDISGWDTSQVTNMGNMFNHASVFNGDISGWNTSQ